jgi:2-amino-4-hydroxy-6-hydroxymethyldihydropteridine diphosphokinase
MADLSRAIRAFIAVGSNVAPERNIPEALEQLQSRTRVMDCSTFYRTPPLNRPDQPTFVNGVWKIETAMLPRALKFDLLRPIEARLGRVRSKDKDAPRPIDLDIVLYGAWVVGEEDLRIPDPDLYSRAFLAWPLYELAPDRILPDSGRKIRCLARSMPKETMILAADITRLLKERLHHENETRVAELIRELLIEIGEDPNREGLLKTPERVARAYQFLTSAIGRTPKRSSTRRSPLRSQ